MNTNLSLHEIQVLASIMQNRHTPRGAVHKSTIDKDLFKAGFDSLKSAVALSLLIKKEMIKLALDLNESYSEYSITEKGEHWVCENENELDPVKA